MPISVDYRALYPIASGENRDRAGVTGAAGTLLDITATLLHADHGTAPFGGMATECGTDHLTDYAHRVTVFNLLSKFTVY